MAYSDSSLTIAGNSGGRTVLGVDRPDSIRLGRYYDQTGIAGRMAYGGERNVLVFGPNGTGKGVRLIAPNLLQCADRSIFVLDPKGELAAITAPHRRTISDVAILNPFGVLTNIPGYEDLQSHGCNPLAALDPRSPNFNSDAGELAAALVKIEGKEPHWDRSARNLVAALIMYVVLEAHDLLAPPLDGNPPVPYPNGTRPTVPTMARVRKLLCAPCAAPSAANHHLGKGIPRLALEMMQTNIDGLINKAGQFTEWNNEKNGIISTAMTQTEFLDDTQVATDLGKVGVSFDGLKKRPTTIYLILPVDMLERHARWLRLIITAALRAVMRPRLAGEPRALFILDEFAALGHIEIIETVWPTVRGYGVQLMPIFQDLTQIQELYGKRWETFVAQAGATVCLTPNDLTTAEWISKRAGETTAEIENESTSDSENTSTSTSSGNNIGADKHLFGPNTHGDQTGWSNGTSTSTSRSVSTSKSKNLTKVPFVQPQTLFGMREGATLSFLAGESHMVAGYAPAYYQIRECVGRARPNPYYVGGA